MISTVVLPGRVKCPQVRFRTRIRLGELALILPAALGGLLFPRAEQATLAHGFSWRMVRPTAALLTSGAVLFLTIVSVAFWFRSAADQLGVPLAAHPR